MPPVGGWLAAVRAGFGVAVLGGSVAVGWLSVSGGFVRSAAVGGCVLTEALFGVGPGAARWLSTWAFGAFVQSSAA